MSVEQPSADKDKEPDQDIIGKPPEDLITGFYNLDTLQTAIGAIGFDVFEELRRIQRVIRDPDPRVSIQGLKHFRSLIKEIGTVAGRIGTARERRIETNDGEVTVREVESGAALQQRLAPRKTEGKFPITQRLPTDRSDSTDAKDESSGDRPASGTDSGSDEPSGLGHGGSGDDRSADLPETVGRGGEPEATLREAGGLVYHDEASDT